MCLHIQILPLWYVAIFSQDMLSSGDVHVSDVGKLEQEVKTTIHLLWQSTDLQL